MPKKPKTKTDRIREKARKKLQEKKPDLFDSKARGLEEPKGNVFLYLSLALLGFVLTMISAYLNSIPLLIVASVLVMFSMMKYSSLSAKRSLYKKEMEKRKIESP